MSKRLFIAVLFLFFVAGMLTTFAESADVPRMTIDELKALLASPDLIILDVRGPGDWKESDLRIKGAVREDPLAVETWAKKYPKDKTLVLYCA
jgi:rhodanese-related sulfurtransferase